MRRSIRDLNLIRLTTSAGLAAAALLAPVTMLQAAPTSTENAAEAPATSTIPDTGTIQGSGLTHARFVIKPSRLSDDGTFRGYLERVGKDAGRQCGKKQENFAWEFRRGDQTAVDEIYQGTMANVEKVGWELKPVTLKTVNESVTTAFTGTRESERIMIVWIPMEDATLMLVCDSN